jgi:esterase/lipase
LIGVALILGCAKSPPELGVVGVAVAPTLDYGDATARVERRKGSEDSVVVRGLGSILMTHGWRTSRVYLLFHGFTDVPTQFEAVGKALFADGANVYIPRLPHHGERVAPVRALGRVRADELRAFGDSSVDIARGLGDSVVVVGLSAGGVIAGWIAQTRRDVRRAVLIAPAIGAGRVSDDDALALVLLASRLPDVTRTNAPTDSTLPEYVQGVSTHGLAEVLSLGHRVRDDAEKKPPGVKDIAFLLSERDQTVSEEAALDLAQRWFDRGAAVTVFRFPNSVGLPHNIMEVSSRGGNPDVAFPVVEALARGITPPSSAELQPVPCRGWRCALRRLTRDPT